MLRYYALVLWGIVVISAGMNPASATLYHYTDLTPLAGDPTANAYGFGSVGGVPEPVGSMTSGNVNIPVAWVNGTAIDLLPAISGATAGVARGVNDSGTVIGWATVNGATSAFYLPSAGNATILPVLNPSGGTTTANGLNNAGQVVGSSTSTDSTGSNHAIVWTSGSGIVNLGSFPGGVPSQGTVSTAQGINNNGQIVGVSYTSTGVADPAMWTYNGSGWTITDLNPTHAVCKGSALAVAVNQSGDAVGNGDTTTSGYLRDPYLFKHDGTVVNLGTLGSSGTQGIARDINNNGVIVGYDGTNSDGIHAFVWTAAAGMQDLNNLLAPDGSGNGWTLRNAYGIDDAGRIAGSATDATGYYHAFLLTPMIPQLPGDATGDGVVHIADLSILLTNFDKSGMSWGQGDFSGDGVVGIEDLSSLLTNFDKHAGLGSSGLASVPEPSSIALLGLALMGFWAGRRRA